MDRTVRHIAALAAALLLGICQASASDRGQGRDWRIEYGAEWGYTATFLFNYHFNYVDSTDGYRVDETGTDFSYRSNAFGLLYSGVDFLGHYSLVLNAGYAGIYQGRRYIPVALRGACHFKSYDESGAFAIAEYGRGFFTDGTKHVSQSYRLGGGYRYTLGGPACLDFIVSARLSTDRPDVYNFNLGDKVQDMYLRRNKAWYGSLNFSIALSF